MAQETFNDRLKILMEIDQEKRPYVWAKKVGIEMGLFQYYWQKGNIPTANNLIKIQKYSGCSIDWLLTGISVSEEVTGLKFKKVKKSDVRDIAFMKDVGLLRKIHNGKEVRNLSTIHEVLLRFAGS